MLILLPKHLVSSFFNSTTCASMNTYMVNYTKARNNLPFVMLVLIDQFSIHCTRWMNKHLFKSVGGKRGQYKMGKHRTTFPPKCSRSSSLGGEVNDICLIKSKGKGWKDNSYYIQVQYGQPHNIISEKMNVKTPQKFLVIIDKRQKCCIRSKLIFFCNFLTIGSLSKYMNFRFQEIFFYNIIK